MSLQSSLAAVADWKEKHFIDQKTAAIHIADFLHHENKCCFNCFQTKGLRETEELHGHKSSRSLSYSTKCCSWITLKFF